MRVSVENGIQAMAAKAHMGIRIIHMRTKINIYTTNQITAVKWSVKSAKRDINYIILQMKASKLKSVNEVRKLQNIGPQAAMQSKQ